jgi:hypothetical protein
VILIDFNIHSILLPNKSVIEKCITTRCTASQAGLR